MSPFTALSSLSSLDLSYGPYEPFNATAMTELRSFSYEFYGFADQMKRMAISLPEGLTRLKVSTLGIWNRHTEVMITELYKTALTSAICVISNPMLKVGAIHNFTQKIKASLDIKAFVSTMKVS